MSTVVYKLVLEGLVPEANDERVRGFLARIFGENAIASPISDNFPREIPGEFDFQRASEWMQALARAGVRSRVEISGAGGMVPDVLPVPAGGDAPKHPLRLWLETVGDPAEAHGWIKTTGPWPAIWLGLALICLGNVLAYPGELWVLQAFKPDAAAASTAWLAALLIFVEPVFRLLGETLLVALALRLFGVQAGLPVVAGIVGPAHALDPLKAFPLVGPVAAWFAWLWLTCTGMYHQLGFEPRRLVAFALLPFALTLIGVMLIALLVVIAVGAVDPASLSPSWGSGLSLPG